MNDLFRRRIFILAFLLLSTAWACTRADRPHSADTVFIAPNGTPERAKASSPAEPQYAGVKLNVAAEADDAPRRAKLSLELPPTPLLCWRQGGQIEARGISSELLDRPLEFRVYTPPCYQVEGERRYPVLYLIHGQSYTHAQWDRIGVDEAADALVAAGELPPFLIVMPRDRVWTSPEEDMFGQALVEDLIPWVDANYRTLPERKYRAVGGLSRGASWAVHLGLRYWELFGVIGAHSLPVFWTDINDVPVWLDAIPQREYPRIFIDVGVGDVDNIVESTIWFGDVLTEMYVPHEWYLFTGSHTEDYWRAHLDQYLRFYAAGW